MSMREKTRREIKAACSSGTLHYLGPEIPGACAREIFVSESVWLAARGPWPDDEDGLRLSSMRAYMDHFSYGFRVTVAMQPHTKKAESFLAPTDPVTDHCWDMRFVAPNARIRVLGHFAHTDCFVALTWDFRENFEIDPNAWGLAIADCKSQWRSLFTISPHRGASPSDYVSKNFDLG